MGRGGPAGGGRLPAFPGLAGRRGRRQPGPGDLAPPVRVTPRCHTPVDPFFMTHLARRLEARMSTTTSHTPSGSEGRPQAATATATGTRPARLIRNESTTEIPVHLLFRDDPGPEGAPARPAVV
ncbi:hypothetical protein ACNFR4_34645, partial [Streptomyces sp. CPS1]